MSQKLPDWCFIILVSYIRTFLRIEEHRDRFVIQLELKTQHFPSPTETEGYISCPTKWTLIQQNKQNDSDSDLSLKVILWVMSPLMVWSCSRWPWPSNSISWQPLSLGVSMFITRGTGRWFRTTKSGANSTCRRRHDKTSKGCSHWAFAFAIAFAWMQIAGAFMGTTSMLTVNSILEMLWTHNSM